MALLKRATGKLQKAGIALEGHRGLWGYYLYNPALGKQRCAVYNSAKEAVQAALRGEQPTPVHQKDSKV